MRRSLLLLAILFALPSASWAGGFTLGLSLAGEPIVLNQAYESGPEDFQWGLSFAGFWIHLLAGIPAGERVHLYLGASVGLWALDAEAGVGVRVSPPDSRVGLELRLTGFGKAYNPLFQAKVYYGAGGAAEAVLSVPLGACLDFTASLGAAFTWFVDFDRFLSLPVELGLSFHPGRRA